MPRIPNEILDKLSRINLIKYLKEKYNVKFTSETAISAQACCPHPDHDDRNPSFSVWKDRNGIWAWCCFSCHHGKNTQNKASSHTVTKQNYGNSIIAFIRWMSDYKGSSHVYSFREAAKIAARYIGINLDEDAQESQSKLNLFKRNRGVAVGCHYNLMLKKNAAYSYLLKRGLTDVDLHTWQIGYNGDRIVFPFKDRDLKTIGFTFRTVGTNNNVAKYINSRNSEIFNKSSYLYGIDKVDASKNYLIVTEGQMDVIAAYKYGLNNTVATSGVHFTEKHTEYIKKALPNINKIIFIYDGDEAGMKGLELSAKVAREAGFMVNHFMMPDNQDLFDYLMANKENGADFILNHNIPYFYKEIQEDIEEFNNLILNYQSKIAPKLRNILKKIKNKDEKYLASNFFRRNFLLDYQKPFIYIESKNRGEQRNVFDTG